MAIIRADPPVRHDHRGVGEPGRGRVVGDHHDRLAEVIAAPRAGTPAPRARCASRGCRSARRRTRSAAGLASARATATRCCWPPESSAGRCPSRSASPVRSITVASQSGSGARAGQRHRQRDVLPRGQRGHQVEGLEHEADPVPAQQRQLPVGQRAQLDVADEGLPGGERVQPGQAVQQRRLAGPGRAHDGGEPPGGELDGHVVQGGDRGVPGAVHLDRVLGAHGCAGSRCVVPSCLDRRPRTAAASSARRGHLCYRDRGISSPSRGGPARPRRRTPPGGPGRARRASSWPG